MSAAVADASSAPPAAGKGKKKLIIILAAVLLLAGLGGGAAVFMMKKNAAAAAAAAAEDGEDAAAPAEHKAAAHSDHPPTYVALDPFTVNLADKEAERYAQIAVTLEVDDPHFAEQMKGYMPSIRSSILMILAHKTSAELLERVGKEALASEIMREAVRPMGIEIEPDEAADSPDEDAAKKDDTGKKKKKKKKKATVHNPVTHVHFANFIIQ